MLGVPAASDAACTASDVPRNEPVLGTANAYSAKLPLPIADEVAK